SSGCPYDCEFCDIPALYGRTPRLKKPEQIIAELEKMRRHGLRNAVYFVDDNFIGNRRAVRELLPVLADWQKDNAYPLTLACEATLNIAKRPEILAAMRLAMFEAIETLNRHGMEVFGGIIMGLDSDTTESGNAMLAFIERSNIPVLTIN